MFMRVLTMVPPFTYFLITHPSTSRWSFVSVNADAHSCAHTHTHTHQLSLFISSKIILHKHESWKTSHFLAGLLQLSWWQSQVNHNRPWVNVSDWKDLPTRLSCQWGVTFPADFPIWPYHCWKPVSEEVSGKMWKRGLPEYGRWRLGSDMVEWLSFGTRNGSLLAIFELCH